MAARSGGAALATLGSLAAQPFGSIDEALAAVFEAMRQLLGMRSLFLSRIDRERGTFQVIAAANGEGGCGITPGDESPLGDHY